MSIKIQFKKSLIFSFLFIFGILSCQQNSKNGDNQKENVSAPVSQNTLKDKIKSSGELIVGFEPDAPPIYFEDNGAKQGFDYELLNHISSELFENVSLTTIEDGYDNLPKLLSENKIEIMAGGRTVEETEGELYSDPYLSFGFCVITRSKDSKKYTDLASISKSRIGVYDDYAASWMKERAPNSNIMIIGDREDENTPESDWMNALLKNEVDVIIYDYPFASNEINDYKNKLTITAKNINESELNEYVLVLNSKYPGAQELMGEINKSIQSFKQSPKYSDAISKYIPNTGGATSGGIDEKNAYTVQRGETLSIIARDHLGDPMKWKELYELNKKQLASPDIIYPGQLLSKPEGWR